jgi:hypothetical protein
MKPRIDGAPRVEVTHAQPFFILESTHLSRCSFFLSGPDPVVSLHGYALGQISCLVDVAAAADVEVTGEEWEGDFEDGSQSSGLRGLFRYKPVILLP